MDVACEVGEKIENLIFGRAEPSLFAECWKPLFWRLSIVTMDREFYKMF